MTTTSAWPPDGPLRPDVAAALPYLNRAIARSRDVALNVEGGDVGGFGSATLVARHVANYQLAADAAGAGPPPPGPVLDVGCGVGSLSVWVGARLGRDVVLCDQDAAVVGFGAVTFDVPAVTDLADADPAPVVLAMEVLEHVTPAAQGPFLRALWDRVQPGGVLVLSTPDETGYPGGWSGYAPHVGCVSPSELARLLALATEQQPTVWRLEGGPFALSPARRMLERVANTAWTAAQRIAPRTARTLAERGSRQTELDLTDLESAALPFHLLPPTEGTGTGLLAVVHRPAAPAEEHPPPPRA